MTGTEETSLASVGEAAPTGEQKVAEPGVQTQVQEQSTETSQVEANQTETSSPKTQTRSNSNWANQRLIEKAIEKKLSSALDEKLAPLLERLTAQQQPSAPQNQDQIDFNDLPGSINRLVEARLRESLKTSLPKLKEEVSGEFRTGSQRQEARNYLISQSDIGQNTAKQDEILEIIQGDPILLDAVERHPVDVIKRAVKEWRESKKNPNAPSKSELSTIPGMGMAQSRNGQPSIQKLKELQDKVSDPRLTAEDKEKLYAEVTALVGTLK